MNSKPQSYELVKNYIIKWISQKKRGQTVVILAAIGLIFITLPNFLKKEPPTQVCTASTKPNSDEKREKLQQNLENIVSEIEGSGKARVLITFASTAETIYATEEKKNKEASEDKSGGEITRKKESNDCEKKYITIKDSQGTEHALAVTELEPKVKGVIVICPGGDNPIVKNRITDAVTTALSITSKHVCITKSI